MTRRFLALLAVAFVVVSALTYGGAPQHTWRGTVVAVVPGEWMAVTNEMTDPEGIRLALVEGTVYKGDPVPLVPGARVRVRFRIAGERRAITDEVELLPARAAR